ncbi:OsmC/Ohr family protein [Geomicrobium sp. JCM 19037]|uniref:OsmC family protein n=1 Tax=Geomicrobium sp. JCM 19037 TaxID=1460634 RepID=UPI00045F4AF1|nr:OsmC family protein [Geomicrobium sp. JCM 19037]GAK05993.1 OsmC/Ohr family protein [Geomicrobium sp. JCM 19037]
MKFTIKNEEAFETDVPYGPLVISGDDEYGYRPYQLLVSAIAGCSISVYRKILRKRRIEFADLIVEADVTRNEEPPNDVQQVHLHFTIITDDSSEEQLEKMMHVAAKNCPIVQSVTPAIEVKETITVQRSK